MIKREELARPDSCMNRAEADEMTFVLLARDLAAPHAIEEWIAERIRLGKNTPGDDQITEARLAVVKMREYQRSRKSPTDYLAEFNAAINSEPGPSFSEGLIE